MHSKFQRSNLEALKTQPTSYALFCTYSGIISLKGKLRIVAKFCFSGVRGKHNTDLIPSTQL